MSDPVIGPTFGQELQAFGLSNLPISWQSDGTIWGRENLTAEQNAGLDEVLARHDPTATSFLSPALDMGPTARQYFYGPILGTKGPTP